VDALSLSFQVKEAIVSTLIGEMIFNPYNTEEEGTRDITDFSLESKLHAK
jgi:hypothetical protein